MIKNTNKDIENISFFIIYNEYFFKEKEKRYFYLNKETPYNLFYFCEGAPPEGPLAIILSILFMSSIPCLSCFLA